MASIDITPEKIKPELPDKGRHFSETNLNLINEKINSIDLSKIDFDADVDTIWKCIKNMTLAIVDDIAPLKHIKKKLKDQFPWHVKELREVKELKNFYYYNSQKGSSIHYLKFKDLYMEIRSKFQSLNRMKMINYFSNKGIKDFKNAKKFWDFYSASINLKSNKSESSLPSYFIHNNEEINKPEEIGDLFNTHFTSLKSNSLSTTTETENFIDLTFSKLKRDNIIKDDLFSFRPTTHIIVEKLLNKLDTSSGAGIAGLPTKLLKCNTYWWAKCLTKLFNKCIDLKQVPIEFKTAVVTPLFKKGDKNDLNNYRGISVLPPVSKIFEKILATQIITFFNINKKFYNGQHGFRASHSCETALHELLTDLNEVKSKKMIALLLFIDYRKAFDLVDSRILLKKLFHYGFDSQY